jgi:hypothetical protein
MVLKTKNQGDKFKVIWPLYIEVSCGLLKSYRGVGWPCKSRESFTMIHMIGVLDRVARRRERKALDSSFKQSPIRGISKCEGSGLT